MSTANACCPACLVGALSAALRRRGIDDGLATLAAEAGMAALGYAAKAWCDDPTPGLDGHLRRAFDAPHRLSSTIVGPDPNVG